MIKQLKNWRLLFGVVIFILIMTAAFLSRSQFLDLSPHTVGFDEAALGYNAYSLLKTGKDEHGRGYSISLASFNDYKPALYAYLSFPFIQTMGLNQVSTRLVSALAGTLIFIFLFLLGSRYFGRNFVLGLFLMALFFLQPWGLHYSRTAFESNLSVFFFTGGALFVLWGQKRKHQLATIVFLLLAMYSYHAARLAAPIFLFLSGVINWWTDWQIKKKRPDKKQLLKYFWPVLILLLFSLPIWLNLKDGLILTRLRQESALKRLYPYAPTELINQKNIWQSWPANPAYYLLGEFTGHFFAYFSPINLGTRLYHWVRSSPQNIAGYSLLGWPETLFFLVGLFYLIKNWFQKKNQIILAWLISGIAPAVVTWNWFHPLRSLNIYPAVALVCLIGLWSFFKKIPRLLKPLVIFGAVLLVIMQAAYLINNELVYNVYESHGEYQPGGFKEGVPFLAEIQDDYQQVIIETPHAQGYIFFLFYQAYPPENLQQDTANRKLPGTEGDLSFNFGKYEFRRIYWPEDQKLRKTVFWGSDLSLPLQEVQQSEHVKIIKEFYSIANHPAAVLVATDNE